MREILPRSSIGLWAATCLLFAQGCSSQPHCISGASESCSCVNGSTGAQVCNSDGVFEACACLGPSGSGGSGGGGAGGGGGGVNGTGGGVGGGAVDGGDANDGGRGDAGLPPDAGFNSFLLYPIAGTTVCGHLDLSVDVAVGGLDAGVAYVAFWLDGVPMGQKSSAPFSWTWDTTQTPNGVHALLATIRDEAGKQTSNTVMVSVSNGGACDNWPRVQVSAVFPRFIRSGGIDLQAVAEDDIGVSSVEFFEGEKSLGSDFSAPYQAFWSATGAPEGPLELVFRAEARDAANHVSARSIRGSTFIDRTPPLLALDSGVAVLDGGVVVPSSVVQYQASDALGPATVSASCSSGAAQCNNGSCQCALRKTPDTMVVTAVDQAGNTTSKNAPVCDWWPSTAYQPTITSPTNASEASLYYPLWITFKLPGSGSQSQFSVLDVDGRVVFSGYPSAWYTDSWQVKWDTSAETASAHVLTVTTYSCGAVASASSTPITVTLK